MTAPITIAVDVTAILARIVLMEERIMTTQAEAFATLAAKDDALTAAVQDLAADFVAFRDAMLAERENLTADGQAAFDAASAKADAAAAALAALDVEVGDAGGSDAAVEPAPETPTE